jgi:hypothetical protein
MMTRREFLKMLGALGLASQLPLSLVAAAEAEPEAPVKPLVTVDELSVEAESVMVRREMEDLGSFSWDGRTHYHRATTSYEVEVMTAKPLSLEFDTVYAIGIQLPGDNFQIAMEGFLKERFADTWILRDGRKPPGFGSYQYLFKSLGPPMIAITEEEGLEWL